MRETLDRRATCGSTSISRASARPRSLTSSDLFTPIFVPEAVQDAVSGDAWLRAMLDAEAALAAAEAAEGVIPAEAAAAIAAARRRLDGLAWRRATPGTRSCRWSRALRAGRGRARAHHGATSQDILDSAAMLVARRALVPCSASSTRSSATCARLAREHRGTVDGRPHAAAAGEAGHVRAQGGRLAGRRGAARVRGCASCTRRCPRSSAAPPGRSPRSATAVRRCSTLRRPSSGSRHRALPVAQRPPAGGRARRGAGHRGGRGREGRARRRAARADRGRRGGRGAARRTRRLVGDAAQAQPGRRDPRARGRRARYGRRPVCCWRRWPASTSARPAPGTASGTRCRTRWPARAARRGRCTRRSTA